MLTKTERHYSENGAKSISIFQTRMLPHQRRVGSPKGAPIGLHSVNPCCFADFGKAKPAIRQAKRREAWTA